MGKSDLKFINMENNESIEVDPLNRASATQDPQGILTIFGPRTLVQGL